MENEKVFYNLPEELPPTQTVLEVKQEFNKKGFAVGIPVAEHIFWRFQTHIVVLDDAWDSREAEKLREDYIKRTNSPFIKIQRLHRIR